LSEGAFVWCVCVVVVVVVGGGGVKSNSRYRTCYCHNANTTNYPPRHSGSVVVVHRRAYLAHSSSLRGNELHGNEEDDVRDHSVRR
jgi:hypothetical protein